MCGTICPIAPEVQTTTQPVAKTEVHKTDFFILRTPCVITRTTSPVTFEKYVVSRPPVLNPDKKIRSITLFRNLSHKPLPPILPHPPRRRTPPARYHVAPMSQSVPSDIPSAPAPLPPPSPSSAWPLTWLTPLRCRLLALLLIAFGVLSRIDYLNSPGALDLAPDEAQFWLWSKHLDWSYYSKPGMASWLIALSTTIFGDTMPAVRYPALALGVGTTLLTYLLTRKLFSSDKLALGAVGLCHVVPMFIAGSMLMTIDPPFVFFWSLATYFFVLAVVDNKKWAWSAAGLAIGLSFLSKYAALLWLVGVVAALLADANHRRHLRTAGPWLMTALAALCTLPVLIWNANHGWVSAQHVRADTTSGFKLLEPLSFLGGTIGAVNPLLFILIIGAIITSLSRAGIDGLRRFAAATLSPNNLSSGELTQARHARLLILTVLPYAVLVTASTFFTNAQINWSAPVWFALLIVTAWFISTRMQSPASWKRWRGLLWGTIIIALIIAPLAHNTRSLYPAIAHIQTQWLGNEKPNVRKWDPTARLQGWSTFAKDLDAARLASVGPDAFFLADDRSDASALAFYAPGQPKTYVMGPYIEDPEKRGRKSQFDLWPDRSLERSSTSLLGKNAIYFGPKWPVLAKAFESVEELTPIEVNAVVNGKSYNLSTRRVYALRNFKGFLKPTDGKIEY